MNAIDEGIRKAAVFVAALDCTAADALLERFPEAQARRVRDAVVALHEIDASEQRRVRDEFLRVRSMVPKAEPAGIELDGRLAHLVPRASAKAGEGSAPAEPRVTPPFAFLSETRDGDLADTLRNERPQAIALVLAHLPPQRASEVLAQLDSDAQTEVIRRLALLEEADPTVVSAVEQAIQNRLARQWGIRPNRVVGMKAVQGILDVGDPGLSQTISETLALDRAKPNERLMSRVAEPPVPTAKAPVDFDELPQLDTASLATLFHAAGRHLAAAALLGAPGALTHRVLSSLPKEESEWLRRQIAAPGPIRLRDVEEARRRVSQLATELQRDGQIQSCLPASRMVLTA